MKGLTSNSGAAAPQAANGGLGRVPLFQRGNGGMLPGRGSQMQYDMVSDLVASAMRTAQGSTNPLVAALTPLLGSAAMARAGGMRERAIANERSEMAQTLFGRELTDAEMGLMGIMDNNNAPGMFRDRARQQLAAALRGGLSSGGGGGRVGRPALTRSGNPTAEDELATVIDRSIASGGDLVEGDRERLIRSLENDQLSSQGRQLVQTILEMNLDGISSGNTGSPGTSAPSAPTPPLDPTTPTAPTLPPVVMSTPPQLQMTPLAQPGGPREGTRPPPPPGTVEF